MSKTKILYISHSSRIGGAEVCLLTLVKHLDKSRFEPVVIFPTPGPLRKQIAQSGIKTYISPLEWWIRAPAEFAYKGSPLKKRVQPLVNIIQQEKPDLIHTNTSVIWEGALAAQFTDLPHLWHIHEILPVHPVLRPLFPLETIYSIINEFSQQVIAVSHTVQSSLANTIGPKKLMVIPNGIDNEKFKTINEAQKSSLREELSLSPDSALALMVGSLVPEKGHDTLLQTAALTKQQNSRIHFVLAGAGNPLAVRSLRQTIRTLGLSNTVHYLGFRQDVPRLMRDSDFLVLPSHTDAFPLAVLEAMAACKPVIATASGGASEMIIDGETGFLVLVADPPALTEKILQLVNDKQLQLSMGTKAHKRFSENYTAEVYAARFQELYQQVLISQRPIRAKDYAKIAVTMRMRDYERLYYRSQAAARRSLPLHWQMGRLLRAAKQLARKRIYEVE